MTKKTDTMKKLKSKKLRRRALRRRRRLALFLGLVAAVLAVLAAKAAPGLGLYVWGLAAIVLAVDALLLSRRRALPVALYAMLIALCLALTALGVCLRDYRMTDDGIMPAEAMTTLLRVSDAWPEGIERYTGVETLDMRGSTVTDFTPILSMRKLHALDVRDNHAFGQAEYEAVADALPNCRVQWSELIAGRYYDYGTREIDLSDAGLTADEITALQARYPDKTFTYSVSLMGKTIATNATALDLQGATDIDPDAIGAALSLLPEVRTVDLRGTPVSADVVAALCNGWPDVHFMFTCALPVGSMTTEDENVTLPGGVYEDLQAYMAFMDYMPNLQTMDARSIKLNEAEIRALQSDERCRKVIYSFTVYGQSVTTLETTLNLDNIAVGGAATVEQVLAVLPNLQQVSMLGCGLSDADMAALYEAHPDIKFLWEIQFGQYKLRTDATAFTTNLYADNKFHYTSETFAPLRYCKDLMMLDLGHCDITDISFISGMEHLRVLILADNEITDLSPLAGLQELEYVEVFLNKIRDFSPLANKPRLVDLNIYYNPIQDLSPLATDTALQRLWLGQCGLSTGQINALKKALPNCKINAKGSASTGHGWREHSHYTTLKQMYKQGVYIPFQQ